MPPSLTAKWDENKILETGISLNGSTVAPSKIFFGGLNKYLTIKEDEDVVKSLATIELDNFYLDPTSIASSNGKIQLVFDGNENTAVIEDDMTKYIADMDIYLQSERRYMIGDSDEFSDLANLVIRESEDEPIIGGSILYANLPGGITWGDIDDIEEMYGNSAGIPI